VAFRYVTGLLAVCLILTVALPAFAQDAAAAKPSPLKVPMFALEDLKPGLKGVGYTVVRGTKIEQFNVEVLELIPDGGFDGGPLVLARYSGGPIEFSGGAGQGYSGSPVYINGKLLGAISTGMPFTDTHIGGITPIQSMLAALPSNEERDYSTNTVLPPSENNGKPVGEDEDAGTKVTYFTDWSKALAYNMDMRAKGEHKLAAVRCTTPVLTSGISPRVLQSFGPQLKNAFGSNLELVDKPMGKAGDYGLFMTDTKGPGLLLQPQQNTPPLAPGDAVTVSLMQGDLELYAVGTVTYTDDDGRILMFGHPFFGQGPTNMPIGKGYITWTYSSIQTPFKQGVRLNTLGTLTRDQSAGCGGTFNEQPDLIPIKVKIVDVDQNTTITKRYEVIRHPDYTPMLVAIGITQAASEALDREPGGTMKMSYHVEGVGLKEPLRRTDYYFDDLDVVSHAAMNLMPLASLLTTNIYRDVKLSKVEVMLEVTRNRVNASIDDAEIIWDKDKAAAGADTDKDAKAESKAEQAGAKDEGAAKVEDKPKAEPKADAASEDGQGAEDTAADEDKDGGKEAAVEAAAGATSGGVLPAPGAAKAEQMSFSQPPRFVRFQTEAQPGEDGGSGDGGNGEGVVMGPYGAMPMPNGDVNIPTFKPGDTIDVKVRLQPYHQEAIWRQFSIKVPADFPAGNTMVVVHGGGDLMSFSELGGKGRSLMGMGPIIDVQERDLDNILTQILEWPTNNELLVTLLRPYDPAAAQELGGGSGEKPEDRVEEAYQMEWVMYNGFMLPVNIVTDDSAMVKNAEMNAEEKSAAGDQKHRKSSNDDEDEDENSEMHLPF
jgi:hypothetical protein